MTSCEESDTYLLDTSLASPESSAVIILLTNFPEKYDNHNSKWSSNKQKSELFLSWY